MRVSSTTISSGPEPSLGVPRNLFSSLAAALRQDLRQTVLGGYIFPSAALSGCISSKHRNSLSLSLCFEQFVRAPRIQRRFGGFLFLEAGKGSSAGVWFP